MSSRKFFLGILVLFLSNPLFPSPSFSEETPLIEDVSDRIYYARVLALISEAKESIHVSMFAIQMQPKPGDPGYELVQALTRAAEAGRKVRLWLNSKQASIGTSQIFMRPDIQNKLLLAGIKIFYVNSNKRLHDKLIVIDRKTVIDGSMNWTREALLRNFESVSIIHSPQHAARKIARMEAFPAEEQALHENASGYPAGGFFLFPLKTLIDPGLFPRALEKHEFRTLALYLLLLEHVSRTKENVFIMNLQEWGNRLPFKKSWVSWRSSGAALNALKFLQGYGLVQWEKLNAHDVKLTLPAFDEKDAVQVPVFLVAGDYTKTLDTAALFAYLIALHKAQRYGSVPFMLGAVEEVAKQFHVDSETLIRGLWDLRRANLLEIYPSEKKLVNGVWGREFANRYLLNPVKMPVEHEGDLEVLKTKYGETLFTKARVLADKLDEPEDPEVIRPLIQLLKGYPEPEVNAAVTTVAGFNRNNVLRTVNYARGILAAEVR